MDFEEGEDLFLGEDEEQGPQDYLPQKDEVIMLIDCSASMMLAHNNGDIPFFMVIKAALGFLKSRILSSETDSIAIILYNTKAKKNHMELENIYVLQDLASPDAQRIKELQTLLDQGWHPYGHGEALLVNALWVCHDILAQNKNSANRRILLFTDEDRPNANHPREIDIAVQRAKDLAQQDISLELYPLNKPDKAFNFQAFYIRVIPVDEDESIENINGLEKLEDLICKMHTKEYKKRKLGTINFALCPNMFIAMNYYCVFRESKKPTPSKLHAKDNKKLKSVTSWICQESGKQLWSHNVGNHYEMGGSKVKFNKEEVAHIKNFDAPGLKLMGFKNRDRIKNYMNVRASYFLYPEENRVKGSSQVVNSLLTSMIKLNKIAIVRFIPRQGAVVRFGALVPSQEPKGFNLIFMPYADDMRNPETLKAKGEVQKAPEDMVKSAAAMIGNIQLGDFDVKSYYNPVLQHFYTNLEALALEEPKPPQIQDSLEPDEEGMQKKEQYIKEFWELAYNGNAKRQTKNDIGDGKKKKGDTYTEGELKKMKVPELKEICDRLGIAKAGRKDDLIERILGKM
ncbi:hypothetical protein SteCoe_1293 [Stentor coeruleus]|uniref:SAP domain-containing protein n=1 Tax=Stentor coeruleus TaxID=5963 RepID=A0A1R2D278_9CILI|nr:hypothetical protein SteCoe_1293 [Stentor coeruleus]